MKNRSKNTKRNRGNGTNKLHTPASKPRVKKTFKPKTINTIDETDPYVIKIRESLMDDKVIDMMVDLYTEKGKDHFDGAIESVKKNMTNHIQYGFSVIDAYERLKENRIIRFSSKVDSDLVTLERIYLKIIFECFTEWGKEIVFHEFTKQMKVQNANGINVISFAN